MDILYYINHVLQKSLNLFNIVNYQTFLKSRSQGQFTRKLGNSIFYFRCVALDGVTGRIILADEAIKAREEILNVFMQTPVKMLSED